MDTVSFVFFVFNDERNKQHMLKTVNLSTELQHLFLMTFLSELQMRCQSFLYLFFVCLVGWLVFFVCLVGWVFCCFVLFVLCLIFWGGSGFLVFFSEGYYSCEESTSEREIKSILNGSI